MSSKIKLEIYVSRCAQSTVFLGSNGIGDSLYKNVSKEREEPFFVSTVIQDTHSSTVTMSYSLSPK